MKVLVCFAMTFSLLFSGARSAAFFAGDEMKTEKIGAESLIRTSALKINVDDMKQALSFYSDKLGFVIEDRTDYPKQVILKTNERIKLILNKVTRLQKAGTSDTQVGLTLQVNDLDQAIERMKTVGVEFSESARRKEAVGCAIFISDPFGRKISLMHQTIAKVEPFKEPKIYNFGLLIPDMNVGRDFYSNKLGFVVRSEKYLPLDLPLGHPDKTFGFMLHYRPGVRAIKSEYPRALPFYAIVFETVNLPAALDVLTRNGVKVVDKKLREKGKKAAIVFEDPFGNISELKETLKF